MQYRISFYYGSNSRNLNVPNECRKWKALDGFFKEAVSQNYTDHVEAKVFCADTLLEDWVLTKGKTGKFHKSNLIKKNSEKKPQVKKPIKIVKENPYEDYIIENDGWGLVLKEKAVDEQKA